MRLLCQHLLSERGEISQQALAQEIVNTYKEWIRSSVICFFQMLVPGIFAGRDCYPRCRSKLRTRAWP